MVSVLPTHRRQGILTKMMREQLTRVREMGEPIAALWASESVIYGRFGYGRAAESVDLKIDRTRVQFAEEVDVPGSLRFINVDQAREQWPDFWDEVRRQQPGMMTRTPAWWNNRVFRDLPENRGGFTANYYVNYVVDGELRGYLRYRRKPEWSGFLANGVVKVEELMATTDDAYRALWDYALNLDLVGSIEAPFRRTDEPVQWMLADPRRLIRYAVDSLWLRIVDVPRALAGRRYLTDGEVVLEVADPFLGQGGRFLLSVEGGQAECARTERAADIEIGIGELASAYFGTHHFNTLARAGRVSGSPGALDRADGLFGWHTDPWCPDIF